MDTLFSLKVFRQVVQSGSFTRAAEQLDISTAMASKHVSHLENSIKAKLLHRNSRNLHLTEAGEEYYRQCSYALDLVLPLICLSISNLLPNCSINTILPTYPYHMKPHLYFDPYTVVPPSITNCAPVTKRDSSDAKYKAPYA